MSITCDPIRKIKVKQSLSQGMDAKNALLDAGYAPATARRSTANKVVKISQAEIIQELTAKDITPEFLSKRSDRVYKAAFKEKKYQAANQANADIAKFMGIDKQGGTNVNVNIVNIALDVDDEALTRLARRRQSLQPGSNT